MSHTPATDAAQAAQAIKDRAVTLRYEGRQFPRTAKTAANWLIRAAEWARLHGDFDLAAQLVAQADSLNLYALCPTPLHDVRPGRRQYAPQNNQPSSRWNAGA